VLSCAMSAFRSELFGTKPHSRESFDPELITEGLEAELVRIENGPNGVSDPTCHHGENAS